MQAIIISKQANKSVQSREIVVGFYCPSPFSFLYLYFIFSVNHLVINFIYFALLLSFGFVSSKFYFLLYFYCQCTFDCSPLSFVFLLNVHFHLSFFNLFFSTSFKLPYVLQFYPKLIFHNFKSFKTRCVFSLTMIYWYIGRSLQRCLAVINLILFACDFCIMPIINTIKKHELSSWVLNFTIYLVFSFYN